MHRRRVCLCTGRFRGGYRGAAIRREALACADAWIAEHGGPPATLQQFAGIGDFCPRVLFWRLDPETQQAQWGEQLDYHARSEDLNDLQQAVLANMHSMYPLEYFALPLEQRPVPTP